MEISRIRKLYRGIERNTLLDLADKYESLGYHVEIDCRDGNLHYDMLAVKGDEKILFEIKNGSYNQNDRERIERLQRYASSHDMKFKLVYARKEVIPHIEVVGLKETLENEFIHDIPSELDSLSTHTRVIEVEDVYVKTINVKRGDFIEIEGSSEVIVDLIYGNEREDDDTVITESFPFTFHGIWAFDGTNTLKLKELKHLDIDTSSFDQ